MGDRTMSRTWTWIDGSKLKVNDVVYDYEYKTSKLPLKGQHPRHNEVGYRIRSIDTADGHRRGTTWALTDGHGAFGDFDAGEEVEIGLLDMYWWLADRGPTEDVPATQVPGPTSTAWNGVCTRCGRGTRAS